MNKGRSIRMFLVDGTPGGIVTAEIMNWTGHVLFGPRSRLAHMIQRDEAKRTGVYFLTGADPDGGYKPLVYVGETDNVGTRLSQHNKDAGKEFWDQACVVTSKDQNLTKAHVKYVESRLIAVMAEAGRAKLVNSTAPEYSQLPEADTADMEYFIDQIRIVLPVLGMDFLKEKPAAPEVVQGASGNRAEALSVEDIKNVRLEDIHVFEMKMKKYDIRALAVENNGEFVVLAGSMANHHGTDSWKSYVKLRDSLLEQGVLTKTSDEDILEFAENYAFKSPSAAACVVSASDQNGRISWKVQGTSKTYADWQEEQVAAVSSDGRDDE